MFRSNNFMYYLSLSNRSRYYYFTNKKEMTVKKILAAANLKRKTHLIKMNRL